MQRGARDVVEAAAFEAIERVEGNRSVDEDAAPTATWLTTWHGHRARTYLVKSDG